MSNPMLIESDSVFKKYFYVLRDKFVTKANKDEAGAVERVNKNKETVYEHQYDAVRGKITNIRLVKKLFKRGDEWRWDVTLTMEQHQIVVSLPFSSRVSKGILLRLPNIDLTEMVKLKAFYFEETNKQVMVVYQGQGLKDKVLAFFTKDNPNGLPPMERITRKGQEEWDDTKQLKWLWEYMNKNYPYLTVEPEPEPAPPKPKPEPKPDGPFDKPIEPDPSEIGADEDDDLPF